jgi:hypothetical protein
MPDEDYWDAHREPLDEEIAALCQAWIRYQRRTVGDVEPREEDPDRWAVEALNGYPWPPQRDLEWRVIRSLCALVDPEDSDTICMIGVGPMEDLLMGHGDDAMDLIEPAADGDEVLLDALAYVWGFSLAVRPRVERYLRAKGREPAGGFRMSG